MKIDGFGSKKVSRSKASKKSSSAGGAKGKGAVARNASKGGAGSSDKIEVSDHIETLDMIRGMVEDTPDIRAGEVDRIVGELKSGKFKINFEKVAEGFIKEAIMNEMAKKNAKKKA